LALDGGFIGESPLNCLRDETVIYLDLYPPHISGYMVARTCKCYA